MPHLAANYAIWVVEHRLEGRLGSLVGRQAVRREGKAVDGWQRGALGRQPRPAAHPIVVKPASGQQPALAPLTSGQLTLGRFASGSITTMPSWSMSRARSVLQGRQGAVQMGDQRMLGQSSQVSHTSCATLLM